jgi:imidazolonepropionase-like amidohydrolase
MPPPSPRYPAAPSRDAHSLLIRGADVFDGESPVLQRADVLVESGYIAAIGAGLERQGARVLDGRGCTLLPGLIDCHVHLTQAYEDRPNDEALPLDEFRRRVAERWAEATLRAGFTTVRDLGAAERRNIALAADVRAGRVLGPEIIASGWRLSPIDSTTVDGMSRSGRGSGGIAQAVNEEIDAGAEVVKLYAHRRPLGPDGEPLDRFTAAELAEATRAAHARARPLAVHTFHNSIAWDGVLAGADSIEHGTDMDDRTLVRMAADGTFYCPSILALDYWSRHHDEIPERFTNPRFLAYLEVVHERLLITVERAYRAGVAIVAGSDQLGRRFPIGKNGGEIGCLARAGLSNLDALRAATSRAARLLGRADRAGRVREGFDADLVLVAGDPLADPGPLDGSAAVRAVIKGGCVVPPPACG